MPRRSVLVTINIEFDDLDNMPIDMFVNELDYEIKSTIPFTSVINTEITDFEEIENKES
jgi:hypothetical protein